MRGNTRISPSITSTLVRAFCTRPFCCGGAHRRGLRWPHKAQHITRGCVPSAAARSPDASATQQANQKQRDRDHQQDVDERADRIAAHEPISHRINRITAMVLPRDRRSHGAHHRRRAGDPRRFATAPRTMAFVGLVPSEHSSGTKRAQGGSRKPVMRTCAACSSNRRALSPSSVRQRHPPLPPARGSR